MRIFKLIPFLILFFILSGCGGHHTHGPDKSVLPEDIERKAEPIVAGETTKSEVRKILGNPIQSNDSWQLDIFLLDHQDTMYISTWAVFPFFTFPTWHESVDEKAFVLVIYGDNDLVIDYDVGFYVEGVKEIRSYSSDDADAAGFLLSIGTPREFHPSYVFLYAPIELSRQVFTDIPKSELCTLFLATEGVSVHVMIDGKTLLDERGYDLGVGFVALPIREGVHHIKVVPGIKPLGQFDYKGEITKTITCTSGESIYAEIYSKYKYRKSLLERNQLIGEIRIINKPSEKLQMRRLILYHNERWIGPPKPTH